MTELAQDLQDIALAEVVCPRCEAGLTDPCTTPAGKPTKMHSGRWEPLAKAFYMYAQREAPGTDAKTAQFTRDKAIKAVYENTSLTKVGLLDLFAVLESHGFVLVDRNG